MSKVVLDASAVIAALRQEPGYASVLAAIDQSVISAVNYAEVVSRLTRTDAALTGLWPDLDALLHDVRPFDVDQARAAGLLEPLTRPFGLSLGDRACLALAQQLRRPVLTADTAWAKLDIGVTIELIRP